MYIYADYYCNHCHCYYYCLCLQDFPAKWIYEPWKAPIADQKQANCRVGVDYPRPMVDHAAVSKENIQKLKDAYAASPPTSKAKSRLGASPAAKATLPGRKPASIPVGTSTWLSSNMCTIAACRSATHPAIAT